MSRLAEERVGSAYGAERRPTGSASEEDAVRLSILHVTAPAPAGGLERVVEGLARGHAARGHAVRVLAVVEPGHDRHPFVAGLTDSRVDVVPLRLPGRAYLREARAMARHCREFRPDVVHTHGFRPDVLDASVARLLGHPVVTTVHGASRMGGVATVYEWLQEAVFRWFDGVVAVSDALVDELTEQGVTPERIALIPNAFASADDLLDRGAARRALGLDEEGFVVGWVGRMIEAKGPDVFIESLQALGDRDVTYSVVGEGPMLAYVRTRAGEMGLLDRVRFHGLVDRAARYFRAFDLFVLSSRTEGTPIALLEAVTAGVPVVATRVGGVPDVVGSEAGWLVPPNDPGALAAAMRTALSDPDARRRRATEARERLRSQYDTEAWLDRYEALYRGVLRRSTGNTA